MDKRKKSKNFSVEELSLLLNLIEETPLLTSKKTDAVTNGMKETLWGDLVLKFNSNGAYNRDIAQIKLKWDNLKKSAKKRATLINSNNRATGGGPSQILPDPVLDKTISIIKMDTCVGPSSYFDDDIGMVFTQDSDAMDTQMQCVENEPTTSTCVIESTPSTCVTDSTPRPESETPKADNTWKEWNPSALRTPVNKKLKVKKKVQDDEVRQSIIAKNRAIEMYYLKKLEVMNKKYPD